MHLEKIFPSLEGLNAGNQFAIMLKKNTLQNAIKIITFIIKGCHSKMLFKIPLLKELFNANSGEDVIK